MWTITARAIASALQAMASRSPGRGRTSTALRWTFSHPIRSIAAFLFAPILIIGVIRSAQDPLRKLIAALGLGLGVTLAWYAATRLGRLTIALLIGSHFGVPAAIAFLVGTTFSLLVSFAVSIVVCNAIASLFLRLSAAEIANYLRSIAR